MPKMTHVQKDALIASLNKEIESLTIKLRTQIAKTNRASAPVVSEPVAPRESYGVGRKTWDAEKNQFVFEAYVGSPAEVKAWYAARNAEKNGTPASQDELALPPLDEAALTE